MSENRTTINNATEEFLNSHKSARSFTDYSVSEAEIQRIIKMSRRAPTSSNLQLCSIVVIRESDRKDTLAELCGGQAHITQCSAFLVFLADFFPLSEMCKERNYPFKGEFVEPFLLATIDAALCAGRALIGAQALGLGGVLVGGIRNKPEQVSELLGLPEFCYPVCGFSLGKPQADESAGKVKPRIPDNGKTHYEHYDRTAYIKPVQEYDELIMQSGLYNNRKVPVPNPASDSDGAILDTKQTEYNWSEHSARRVSSDARGALRPDLRRFLEQKGFLLK